MTRIQFNGEQDGYNPNERKGGGGGFKKLKDGIYLNCEGSRVKAGVFGGSGDLAVVLGVRPKTAEGEVVKKAYLSSTVYLAAKNPHRDDHEVDSEKRKDRMKTAYKLMTRLDPNFPRKNRWDPDEKQFYDVDGNAVNNEEAAKANYALEVRAMEALTEMWNAAAGEAADTLLDYDGSGLETSEGATVEAFTGKTFFARTAANGKGYINLYVDNIFTDLPDGASAEADESTMFAEE